VLAAYACFFFLFVQFIPMLEDFCRGHPPPHSQRLQETFWTESSSTGKTPHLSLALPWRTKTAIVLLFIICALWCWVGVLMGLSLLNALIVPTCRLLPTQYGQDIVDGTAVIAVAILGNVEKASTAHLMRFLLTVPVLLPVALFVSLHLRALVLGHRRVQSLTPVGGPVAAMVNDVSAKMGVRHVRCVLDVQSNRLSPYAVVRGWRPARMIVFTSRALTFHTNHPEHAEAIIAHEVAHLKLDCMALWGLRCLSRLALVGAGFLSPLHDSIAMEDRADEAARSYLRGAGKNQDLLGEAASIIEAQDWFDSEARTSCNHAFAREIGRRQGESAPDRLPFGGRVASALRDAHEVYFWVDLYDYVHRPAEARYTSPKSDSI
jgi:hypothetical protein